MNEMKLQITVREAERMLGDLAAKLRNRGKLYVAIARALNRARNAAFTEMVEGIQQTYAVKRKGVQDSTRFITAKAKKLESGFSVRGRTSIPLVFYSSGGTKKTRAISVRIFKTSSKKVLRPGGDHQILSTKKNKKARAWRAKGQILAQTEGGDEPKMLFGPTFMSRLSDKDLRARIQMTAEKVLRERLVVEAGLILEKMK